MSEDGDHSIEGGALTYSDSVLKERLELSRNFGFKGEEQIVAAKLRMVGLDGLQAKRPAQLSSEIAVRLGNST